MGHGPGRKQKALIRALRVPGAVVWVVPPGVNRSEATVWRRSARAVVRRGKAKAVYLRREDALGRMVGHLALVAPDSEVAGDALPLRSPSWVQPPPVDLLTLSGRVQALVLSEFTGTEVSPSTASRVAKEYRRSSRGPIELPGGARAAVYAA
jgi:hypothetical protein